MKIGTCKLLHPSRIYCFSERKLYTQKNISCYQVAVVTLFWAQKRKLTCPEFLLESKAKGDNFIFVHRAKTVKN